MRWAQLNQLAAAVKKYREKNPSNAVFVIGDFNIYGENLHFTEYNDLIERIGKGAGGRDADRNAPGFVFDYIDRCKPSDPMSCTACDCNPVQVYFGGDDTISGRLDYIFYIPSLDGSVEVLPTDVNVLPFRGRNYPICISRIIVGSTPRCVYPFVYNLTNESSDHWAVHGKFKIIRK